MRRWKGRRFTADFETTTDINDCRVWSWGVFEVGSKDGFEHGTDIDSFMEWCANPKHNYTVAFHNLKFDGQFILYWLQINGFKWCDNKKNATDKTFTTLITDMGQFYSIEVFFRKGKGKKANKVKFTDSMKLINLPVAEIPKAFGLKLEKLDIDYEFNRPVGYQLTEEEISYLRNDVEIVAQALEILYSQGATKLTIASCALADYKERNPKFNIFFPKLNEKCDADIRMAYKGGFTYVNPESAEKEWGEGCVFDVNSEYPSVLRNKLMPYDKPVYFEGRYEQSHIYPLYIQQLYCKFRIKEGKIPSIQIKNNPSYMPNAYLTDGNWDKEEGVLLALCSVDLELFFDQYEVKDIEYIGGWKMKGRKGMFNSYIEHWMKKKVDGKKRDLKGQTQTAKLYLNSLYGKFGTNANAGVKEPYIDSDGIISYRDKEADSKETVYIPIAVYTTAYGRDLIIRSSNSIRDWSVNKYGEDLYRYSDTDSIHMCVKNMEKDVEELSNYIEIDDYKLGAWKLESKFVRGKWLRQKCYIEQDEDGTINSTIAGMPKKLNHLINFDNFKIGFTTADFTAEQIGKNGKKKFTYCKGGVVLTPTDFTIK